MTQLIIFSQDIAQSSWADTKPLKLDFGPKAATLAAIPRAWTPPFILLPASTFDSVSRSTNGLQNIGTDIISKIQLLSKNTGKIIVRSSVIGETIWDRGTYLSEVVEGALQNFSTSLSNAIRNVLLSGNGKQMGIIIQSYIEPRARGEFGNLIRISKTRDHWELTTYSGDTTTRDRFNTQRDEAAEPQNPLSIRPRITRKRQFSSIAAWLNNYLLRGRSERVNCEWVADHENVYVVQLDEEDEDFFGINPFQVIVQPVYQPKAANGTYMCTADSEARQKWDKLRVLNELWDEGTTDIPTLFYVPLSNLPSSDDNLALSNLERDFEQLIGPDKIVVRTSVEANTDKIPNLKRTEGVTPSEAAIWCLKTRDELNNEFGKVDHLAFVVHRFIAARAAAWARAKPGDPHVEIHGLWGLPDALQYCSYDIWEVHIPTEVATEYPDYKSHMLIARDDGDWEYVRIKNELGRSMSIGRREALDIATRTSAIAERLGQPCHVMWFVGCVGSHDRHFSIPWYWTKAHDSDRNVDRLNYQIFRISNQDSIENFSEIQGPKSKYALELKPDQNLIRDTDFISEVGKLAKNNGVPVILSGSTLAHSYFVLRREGCAVVARGEKDHSRVRRNAIFGKLVRDKIPARIAERKEVGITQKVPENMVKSFLIGKLIEEAIEVRGAKTKSEKRAEFADVYEVLRALARIEGISIEEVAAAADIKRQKAGGFDDGLVLFQTGILGRDRDSIHEDDRHLTQVLARKLSGSTYELPFTFFGFMGLDQPRSMVFEDLGIRVDLTLKADRIELRASREAEQLELPLDMVFSEFDDES